jgi:hypothetical protein
MSRKEICKTIAGIQTYIHLTTNIHTPSYIDQCYIKIEKNQYLMIYITHYIGNSCECVTITSSKKLESGKGDLKPAIVISARIHPVIY